MNIAHKIYFLRSLIKSNMFLQLETMSESYYDMATATSELEKILFEPPKAPDEKSVEGKKAGDKEYRGIEAALSRFEEGLLDFEIIGEGDERCPARTMLLGIGFFDEWVYLDDFDIAGFDKFINEAIEGKECTWGFVRTKHDNKGTTVMKPDEWKAKNGIVKMTVWDWGIHSHLKVDLSFEDYAERLRTMADAIRKWQIDGTLGRAEYE